MTPAEDLERQFPKTQMPPPGPPPTNLTSVPSGIQSSYMAHTEAMRGAAASEQLDAMFPREKPPEAKQPAKPAEATQPATVAPGGQVDQAVQAEMQRLQTPPSVAGSLQDRYGKDLPNVLRAKAEENLGIKQPTVLDKAEAVGSDIGKGIIESPAVAIKGFRDAYQSIIDLGQQAGEFANHYMPALQV